MHPSWPGHVAARGGWAASPRMTRRWTLRKKPHANVARLHEKHQSWGSRWTTTARSRSGAGCSNGAQRPHCSCIQRTEPQVHCHAHPSTRPHLPIADHARAALSAPARVHQDRRGPERRCHRQRSAAGLRAGSPRGRPGTAARAHPERPRQPLVHRRCADGLQGHHHLQQFRRARRRQERPGAQCRSATHPPLDHRRRR